MLKQFFILLFLSIVLTSSHENTIINIRSIEGEIIEGRLNQRIIMEINGYIRDDELISFTFLSNDESKKIYIIKSICYKSTIIKEGISLMKCMADFSNVTKGNYILQKFRYTYKGTDYENIIPVKMIVFEDVTKAIYLIDFKGDIVATGEKQAIKLYFNRDITSLHLKSFKYLGLESFRGMAHPGLDCKVFLAKNALYCLGDFTGTYDYEHKILDVVYGTTSFYSKTTKTLTPKSTPTKHIKLEKVIGNIRAFSANQELYLDIYDNKNKDKFDFNLNLKDIKYLEFFCFDDYTNYRVNLRCHSKEAKQNSNLVKCNGDFNNIEKKYNCKVSFIRYKFFTIFASYSEFPILG